MRILKADELGMCFGVRDALAFTESIADPAHVTIHGELVHNEKVLDRLQQLGFARHSETSRAQLPATDTVLVTAHGISHRERERLLGSGKRLLDSTCPLVTRAHDAAQMLQKEGYHVLVIGKPGHVEVQGIVEDLDSYSLVPNVKEVVAYPYRRLGVMCQTTTPVEEARAIVDEIRRRNPEAEVSFVDTVCHPTKDRQDALERLLDQVQAVVVVGGKNSNNTRQLVHRCEQRGVRAYHVQEADDIHEEWFADVVCVGLTAGTSTLSATIEEVETRLREIASRNTV